MTTAISLARLFAGVGIIGILIAGIACQAAADQPTQTRIDPTSTPVILMSPAGLIPLVVRVKGVPDEPVVTFEPLDLIVEVENPYSTPVINVEVLIKASNFQINEADPAPAVPGPSPVWRLSEMSAKSMFAFRLTGQVLEFGRFRVIADAEGFLDVTGHAEAEGEAVTGGLTANLWDSDEPFVLATKGQLFLKLTGQGKGGARKVEATVTVPSLLDVTAVTSPEGIIVEAQGNGKKFKVNAVPRVKGGDHVDIIFEVLAVQEGKGFAEATVTRDGFTEPSLRTEQVTVIKDLSK